MIQEVFQYVADRIGQAPGAFWSVLTDMAPFLLLGFAMAGVLSVVISPATVERHLGGRGVVPILKAVLLSLPLPLCSCGVIPVSASLRRHGASRGATIGFLITTPQTGVDCIAVTYSLLGLTFAIFMPSAALVSGLLGGLCVEWATRKQRAGGNGITDPPACQDACCAMERHSGGRLRRILVYGFHTLPKDLAKSLLVGVAIAAAITVLLPEDFFRTAMGGVLAGGVVGILVMIAVGVPLYVCTTASVPMAWALMAKGISPGAAFAFLVAGPATNAATIAMIWKVMGRRTAITYLAVIAVVALGGGMLLDVLPGTTVGLTAAHPAGHVHGETTATTSIFDSLAAVVLLAVLGAALVGRRREHLHHIKPETADTVAVDMTITGMTCEHCVAAVRRALLECPGVVQVEVGLADGVAEVAGTNLDGIQLTQAVEALGYKVTGIQKAQPNPKEGAS